MGQQAAVDEPSRSIPGLSATDEAELFRGVSASAPNGVVLADADGIVVWANGAAERIFGWPAADLVGKPLVVLVADDVVEDALRARRRVLAGESVDGYVTTGQRRDGERFRLEITPAVRRDEDGRVLGISVIATDLTDEVRLRHELTEALARSHARFDQVARPQALLDLDARFVSVNDAACQLLGWRREQLLGRDSGELVYPVDPTTTVHTVDALRAGAISSASYEVVAIRGDGAEVPLLIDVSVVRDDTGTPRELAVFAHDLSEIQEAQRRLKAQDAFFRALYRRATDVVIVSGADRRVRWASPSCTQVLGYQPEDLVNHRIDEFLHPDDLQESLAHRETLLELPPDQSARRLLKARTADGGWRWLDGVTTNCIDDPDIGGLVTNLRDVTVEIEAQRALHASESRFRAIVETAQEGIIALDPDGAVLFANEKLAEIVGLSTEEVYATGLPAALGVTESGRVLERARARERVGPDRYEVPYLHPDGSRRVLLVAASPLNDDDGHPIGSLGMVSDVTLARKAEDELRHQALHDALTGLPNRTLLVDRITMAAARQQRDDAPGMAVLFLDLDHFKLVNDSRGHEVGDRLLVEVAARLQAAVCETDTVARLGGDEFAVVCEDARLADDVADRILAALKQPFRLDGEHVYVSASIGIALSPPYAVADLLRFADAAMYDAKAAGRSQVATFEGPELVTSTRRLAIAAALREALEDDGLTLGYQMIVDFERGRLLGLEALLRWTHPVLGAVGPEEVVTAAETSGLSFELDRAVIRRAGADLVALRRAGVVADDVLMSVNISPRTAQQQRLDALVQEMLGSTGLPASCLSLEITEHAIMDNAERAVDLLSRLAEAGVGVAIDDFGTGYNSLVHLQRLPVNVLKIDRSFVRDIATRPESLAIARSIVGLATAIGLDTVAEGIETEEQVRILRGLGCRTGQGYLWGRAVAVRDLAGTIERALGRAG